MKILDELEALRKAATEGEWTRRWDGTLGRATVLAKGLVINIQRAGYGNVAPEGSLIIAAVNALPELVAVARAAQSYVWAGASHGEINQEEARQGLNDALARLAAKGQP